jgi:hypothetical protein
MVMATINEKMITLADAIRSKAGIPGALSINGMISAVENMTAIANEAAPYISRIIPAVQLQIDCTVTSRPMGTRLRVTKTTNVSHQSRIYVELVNMYNESLTAKELVLYGVEVGIKINVTPEGKATLPNTITVKQDTLTIPIDPTTVSAHGYAVSDAVFANPGGLTNPITENIMLGSSDPIPNTDVTVEVTGIKFDRAVLSDDTGDIDSVESVEMGNMPQQVMDPFIFGDTDVSKELAVYADFQAKDPRFNLSGEDWTGALITRNNALTPDDLPNYGEKKLKGCEL